MTWFRVDDSFNGHPKAAGLCNDSLATWTRAGDWCAWQLTDGAVPASMLPQFAGDAADPEAAARDLVDRRLWEITDQGWLFHDWPDWNPTRAKVLGKRKKDADRRREWLARAAAARNAVSHDVSHSVSHDVIDPDLGEPDGADDDHSVSHGVHHAAPDPTRPEGEGRVQVDNHRQGRNAPAHEDDDDSLTNTVFAILRAHGPLERDQAAAYRRSVLAGARGRVDDPAAYVVAAIRKDIAGAYREATAAVPVARATRQPPPSRVLCRRCSKVGHDAEHCPTLEPFATPGGGEDIARDGAAMARKMLADSQAAPDPQPGADPDEIPEAEIVDDEPEDDEGDELPF